jgi:hypothetical protein
MPKEFDACRANKGKIRTIALKGGKYMHICILNGKTYKGEVKVGKGKAGEGSQVAAAMKEKMKG